MKALRFEVRDRLKENELHLTELANFEWSESAEEVDAESLLLDPTVTLYCFDDDIEHAVFVGSEKRINPREEPFYFVAQYRSATHLYFLPIDSFRELAKRIEIEEERVSFVHSVGRCGSTLISKAFAAVDSVESYSEPDVFMQLLSLRGRGKIGGDELTALTADCVRWTLRPELDVRAVSHWSIKFRSQCTEMAGDYFKAFPKSKMLFLYRDWRSWLGSVYRAFIDHETEGDEEVKAMVEDVFKTIHPVFSEYVTEGRSLPLIQSWLLSWVGSSEAYLKSCDAGGEWVAASFDQIKEDPRVVVERLFEHCGIVISDEGVLESVFARDSQEGSVISRKEIGEIPTISEAELTRLEGLLRKRVLVDRAESGLPYLIEV
ncbi:hypothetical protein [Pelagicoccus mobilis]|uniref:Sulfotransferase family protein n=1 Tax=Pelagicoccus mobilis TaxID=415221 RepID=A0A934RX80_9BACT|nr:hypothetical protein [Pelagicoccus mobilis]MBK1876884.1 hypothetical protein [Pelagicoccus mobilis]